MVRGRLWRMSDPSLPEHRREALVKQLMDGRRGVGAAKRSGDVENEKEARKVVDAAKRELGERGPVWWTDGSQDYNRHMAEHTPYADWYAGLADLAG